MHLLDKEGRSHGLESGMVFLLQKLPGLKGSEWWFLVCDKNKQQMRICKAPDDQGYDKVKYPELVEGIGDDAIIALFHEIAKMVGAMAGRGIIFIEDASDYEGGVCLARFI